MEKKTVAFITFSISLIAIFFIDFLTKSYLYDLAAPAKDYKIIGVRSLAHDNSTLFSFLSFKMELGLRNALNFGLIILFCIPVLFIEKKVFAIAFALLIGGMLGNSLDVAFQDGGIVRDIFYTPWLDKGTFNAADLFIVIGSILLVFGNLVFQLSK